MAKKKYYGVKVGKTPGVYLSWEECKEQVDGFPGAVYKGFADREEALQYAGVPDVFGEAEPGGTAEAGHIPPGEAVAYVDGSYHAGTKEYSCGIVFMTAETELHIAKKGENEELASMRNVAGEILGAELAMQKAVELGMQKLTIYYDYQGIASWCLGEWKTNKEGTRAYKEYFDSVLEVLDICFVKVKGHSGDKYNDLADELAKSAFDPNIII